MAPLCNLCSLAPAAVYCVNDDASLCTACDVKYHSNPLAARHERRAIPATAHNQPAISAVAAASSDDLAVVPQCSPNVVGPSCALAIPTAPLMFQEEETFFPMSTSAFIDTNEDIVDPAPTHNHGGAACCIRPQHGSLPADLADLDFGFDFGIDAVVPSISDDERFDNDCAAAFGDMGGPIVSIPTSGYTTAGNNNAFMKTHESDTMFASATMVPQDVSPAIPVGTFNAFSATRNFTTSAAAPQKPSFAASRQAVVGTVATATAAADQDAGARTARRRPIKRRAPAYYDDDEDSEISDPEFEAADDDSDDDDFSLVSSRRIRGGAASRRTANGSALAHHHHHGMDSLSAFEPELSREERIQRYREKRARRNFNKTVRYQSRKAYADVRPRIKGRFVSPEEYAAYMSEQKQHDAPAVVPCC